MSEIKDGGPAFPRAPHSGEASDDGMSLRDYFAAKAMQAAITGAQGIGSAPDETRLAAWAAVSRLSYEIADAMVKERAK